MTSHAREHEELVQRILAGDLAENDPQVRERLRECPDCRAELEGLRALEERLHGAVEQERADLARARTEADRADEELVRHSLAQALATRRDTRGRDLRRRLFVFAVAAGLLLVGSLAVRFFLRSGRAVEGPEILLSGGTVKCQAPLGPHDYDVFLWSFKLPPEGSFELTLRALEEDKGGTILLPPIEIREPSWTPTPEQKRALPARIYWEVLARDASGAVQGQGWAKAWR